MGIKKLFDQGYKELKRCQKIANQVMALEVEMQALSDEQLQAKTPYFKELLKNGKKLSDILPQAYAVVREAAWRKIQKKPFYVQVVGATAIHGGNIAEMRTGEGKTLTAVMPAYLNALEGRGVHVVTVNEYLAAREVEGEIGDLFRFLGLTVGLNLREKTQDQKREAYDCDILYSTNSELGFDYLRDHMVLFKKDLVQQRGLNYAIIDEVDSILIDEARTPLIISGGQKNNANLYLQADTIVKRLADEDYEIDIEARTIALTPSGISRIESAFKIANLYDIQYVSLVHHINNSLKANYIFKNGVEYAVIEGQIMLIDQFTGRILKGRQYSDGLHQAIEAKEGVEIKKETVTVATITYQNFFRMYNKLSGMTGTAKTEEEEFVNIYNMYVVEVPTNKPIMRVDKPDLLFIKQEDKFNAMIEEIKEKHALGQPILIGTVSVEMSEHVSKLLKKQNLKHEMLNAKNHEREAEIIEKAGEIGAITLATNMAGRGTDIKLAKGVIDLGGLAVFGTERHESRRIDNQLRGRAGRQGDPGYSRFYTSTEDDLILRFGGDKVKDRLAMFVRISQGKDSAGEESGISAPLESKFMTKRVTKAQERIEGSNFDSRKNVLKYDDVIRRQREIFYEQRMQIITNDSIEDIAHSMIKKSIEYLTTTFIKEVGNNKYDIDDDAIAQAFNEIYYGPNSVDVNILKTYDEIEVINYLFEIAKKKLDEKKALFPGEAYEEFLKVIVLRILDTYWTKHIDAMSALRQGVGLQSYGQGNPLQIYQQEGYEKFQTMLININNDVLKYLVRAQVRANLERQEVTKNTQASDGKETLKKVPVKNDDKVGRNDMCPCGSGKKYKLCHGS